MKQSAESVPNDGVQCSQCHRSFPADQVVMLGGGQVCADCKPAALQKLQEGILVDDSPLGIRRFHLRHESSIKSIGVLLYVAGVVAVLYGGLVAVVLISLVFDLLLVSGEAPPPYVMALLAGAGLSAAALLFAIGRSLRAFKNWARVACGIFSGLGLIGFPIGTLIGGYILWLLFSKKGATIFSAGYRRVVAETPQIKYRSSASVVILVVIVAALVLAGWMGAKIWRPT